MYYGIVFPNRDIGQIKKLEYVPPNTLEATFTLDENKVKPEENFLAILETVNENKITESTSGKLACQIGTKARVPQVVNFG